MTAVEPQTLKELFIPYIGSSTMMSASFNTSFETPYVSLPAMIAQGNFKAVGSRE